jgi:hypothetical protein
VVLYTRDLYKNGSVEVGLCHGLTPVDLRLHGLFMKIGQVLLDQPCHTRFRDDTLNVSQALGALGLKFDSFHFKMSRCS